MADTPLTVHLSLSLAYRSAEIYRYISQRGERVRSNEFGMNLVVIEEHQVGDLVFAQLYYLYIC